jgi:hypothetical protein
MLWVSFAGVELFEYALRTVTTSAMRIPPFQMGFSVGDEMCPGPATLSIEDHLMRFPGWVKVHGLLPFIG